MHSELARLSWASLSQLVPPYRTAVILVTSDPDHTPLGTILHGEGPSGLGVLGSVALALRWCPWLLPVITFPPDEERLEPLVEMISELRDRVAITQHASVARTGAIAAIIDAAARRPAPGPDTMSRYTATRVGAPDLLEPLTEQFSRALEGTSESSRSVATYSRMFARYGRYTARDWRALAKLAHDLSARPFRPWPVCKSSDPYAMADMRALMASRTANLHARYLLGMSLTTAGERLGWEWVFEQALRRGGYVGSPKARRSSN